MPDLNGIEATKRIRQENPNCKVIILSVHQSEGFIKKSLHAGASGYLLKTGAFDELEAAIRTVLANKIYLSPEINEDCCRKLCRDDRISRIG